MQPETIAAPRLPARPRECHKGSFGRLLIVAGSVGYTGAPTLCARAAVRAGAGLVFLGVPEAVYAITAVKNDEAMPFPLPCGGDGRLCEAAADALLPRLERCTALVLGPGLGRTDALRALVPRLTASARCPVVLDADALWAAADAPACLRGTDEAPVIVTPHLGEFALLGGRYDGDRAAAARAFSLAHGCITVLKGPGTAVAFPDGDVCVNPTGGPGLAKGGSGDVLAGVLGALLGQLPLREAVRAAVWLHGRAGDLACALQGEYAMTASDVIAQLGPALSEAAAPRERPVSPTIL